MAKRANSILFFVAVVLMALFGLAGLWIGAPNVLHWADIPTRYVGYYGISLLAGLALLGCSLLSIRIACRRPMALGGGAAAVVLLFNQFLGLRFQAILCFTPT